MSRRNSLAESSRSGNEAEHSGVVPALADLIALRQSARQIKLPNNKLVYTHLSGQYRSGYRGYGIDFDEVRPYQAGDDVRSIDWRVTARTGKPSTKLYKEARERPVFIVIDYGASLFFGTRVAFKSVIASQVAALLAWATVDQSSRLGAILYAGEQQLLLKPKVGPRAVLGLLQNIQNMAVPHSIANDATATSSALMLLRQAVQSGSLIFIISDFSSFDSMVMSNLAALTKANVVVAVQVYDQLEETLPPPNRYSISNGLDTIVLDTAITKLRQQYQQSVLVSKQQLQQQLAELKVPLISIRTDQAVVEVLGQACQGGQFVSTI